MEPWKLKLGLLVLILVALTALVFWLRWRADRKDALDHAASLAEFAASVGGTATDASGNVSAWSAGLLRPFAHEYGDVISWLHRASDGRFDHALEFDRHGWRVRVTEASIELNSASTPGNVVTHHEHRIEVAASGLVPLKIAAPDRGKWAGEPPQSLVGSSQPWQQLRLPAAVQQAYVACTSDPHAAAALFTTAVTDRLLGESRMGDLRPLTFEAGIAYSVAAGQIDPKHLLRQVDAVIGLLERMPGVRPSQPAPTV